MELNIEYIFILCVLYINDIGDDEKPYGNSVARIYKQRFKS